MRRLAEWILLVVGLVGVCVASALAQSYPSRTIQIIVPFPAGGPTDVVGRRIADKLQQSLGKPVIVENRAGAGTVIGTESVGRSEPDGYTILCSTSSTFVLAPSLYKGRNFSPKTTLVPIVLAVETPMVLVASNSVPANTFAEFIAYAKANPGKLSFASVGAGTIPHLMGEMMKDYTGIDLQHVPYKGSAPAETAVMAGEVAVIFDQLGTVLPFIQAGRMKALAVAAPRPYPELPGTPTIKDVGLPLLSRTIWTAFAAPTGTPPEIVQTLNREINKALADPEVVKAFAQTGTYVVGGSPEQFRDTWQSDESFWSEAVAKTGLRLE